MIIHLLSLPLSLSLFLSLPPLPTLPTPQHSTIFLSNKIEFGVIKVIFQ